MRHQIFWLRRLREVEVATVCKPHWPRPGVFHLHVVNYPAYVPVSFFLIIKSHLGKAKHAYQALSAKLPIIHSPADNTSRSKDGLGLSPIDLLCIQLNSTLQRHSKPLNQTTGHKKYITANWCARSTATCTSFRREPVGNVRHPSSQSHPCLRTDRGPRSRSVLNSKIGAMCFLRSVLAK